ncbi:trigger factor [Microlunatus sagamiharensis]|uniref:Trigger factor n=1 Tax=Microlunatus sagamiharensis TaxID=546874 RepID=A0A1H2LPW5_9ACTN|nr:trigger factor [Microlunatus sagamiharensis]SDU82882.1 trigger factor [Microlunatus sagamiharensis]
MPSTVEQLSPTRVKITVEIPFRDLKPSLDKAYADIARTITVPGFRKGKVPPMVIDQRFGRGVVIQEAFNDSWSRFYGAAVTENSLTPLAQPDVEVTKLEDGDLIEFTAEVDVRPEFEVPDTSAISVQVGALEVADGIVDSQIDVLRSRFGSRTTVERGAAEGDLVTLSLTASNDGEALPDATAEDLEYTVGSGQMLDGLDEAITGLSAGESATFRSTLVGGPLKDEEADIEVTVAKVQSQELPEADDDFAQEASEFDTIEELRASIETMATNAARLEQATQARDAVLEALVDSIDVAVPENLLTNELEGRRQQITGQLAQAGLTLEQYLADSEEDQTEEEFWADVERRANQSLKAQMVLDKVAETSEIGVDQNDLTQHILRRAQAEGTAPQQIAEHLQEHPHHIEEYMVEIRRGKALASIVEAATVTDSNGGTVDLSSIREDGSLGSPEDDAQDEAAAAAVLADAESAQDEQQDEDAQQS